MLGFPGGSITGNDLGHEARGTPVGCGIIKHMDGPREFEGTF
jgi:hypothetical protein